MSTSSSSKYDDHDDDDNNNIEYDNESNNKSKAELHLERLHQASRARSAMLERQIEEMMNDEPDFQSGHQRKTMNIRAAIDKTKHEAVKNRKAIRKEIEEFDAEEAEKFLMISEKAKETRRMKNEIFEWKKKHTQLKHKIQMYDRERLAALKLSSHEMELDFADITKYEADLDSKRHQETRLTENQLDKIRYAIRQFVTAASEMDSGPAKAHQLEKRIQKVETNLNNFKEMQMEDFEHLAAEERDLTLEIEILKDKFDSEEFSSASKPQAQTHREIRQSYQPNPVDQRAKNAELQDEIANIDELIAMHGGSNGNWDPRDHSTFLKLVSRYRIPEDVFVRIVEKGEAEGVSLEKFLDRATMELPTQSESDIWNHVEWYGQYLALVAKKKDIVKQWKTVSKSSRSLSTTDQSVHSEETENSGGEPAISKEQARENRRRLQEEQEFKRRAVQEWKQSKLAEARAKEAAEETRREQEREKNMELARQRQDEKERIALFKLQKEAEEARRRHFEENSNKDKKDPAAAAEMKRRQEQSIALAKTRREMLNQKSEQEVDRATKIANIKVKPAIAEESQQALRNRSADALTRTTSAFDKKKLTPDELHDLGQRRQGTGAHQRAVASTSGVAHGRKSYGIGVNSSVSGRSMASWKRGLS